MASGSSPGCLGVSEGAPPCLEPQERKKQEHNRNHREEGSKKAHPGVGCAVPQAAHPMNRDAKYWRSCPGPIEINASIAEYASPFVFHALHGKGRLEVSESLLGDPARERDRKAQQEWESLRTCSPWLWGGLISDGVQADSEPFSVRLESSFLIVKLFSSGVRHRKCLFSSASQSVAPSERVP